MIRWKLIVEQCVFNILMYAIVLIGSLAAISINMFATAWNPILHWYTPLVSSGTLYGAALCHYFLHRSESYCLQLDDSEATKYSNALDGHANNSMFVGITNMFILLILTGVTAHSLYSISIRGWVVGAILYGIAIMLFVLSKPLAEGGWAKKIDLSSILQKVGLRFDSFFIPAKLL